MRFAALHTFVTYLLAALGLYALTLGGSVSLPAQLAIVAGFFGSLLTGPRLWERPGYTTVWNVLVLVILALVIARGILGEPLLGLGLEFAAFLQIAKLFYRRSARDHQQVLALAFLHLIAATILTTGIDYGFAFLGFVLVTPWMFALTHLRAEIERHYGPEEALESEHDETGVDGAEVDPRSAAKLARVLGSRKVAGWRFLAGTAGLSLPLFLVTAAFFLLFPRVGMGFLAFGQGHGRQVAGFGSNVELGGFGTIRSDPTVVLRVQPEDAPATPGDRVFRLRGTSFDRYEEGRWTRTPEPPARMLRHGRYAVLHRPPRGRNETRYRVHLDPLQEPVVFLLPHTIALRVPPRVESAMDVERRLDRSEGLDVRYQSDGVAFRYTLVVAEDAPAIPDELDEAMRERYLQLPLGQGRVRALARRLAGEGTSLERARRLEQWLKASGEMTYSLELPDVGDRDPLEVFLFDAKRGHCEYFSTALAVMLRGEGIPARNVTGFVGGRYNEYGQYYAIAQGDAHSWVEAYVDGRWRTFDPTPTAFGEASPPGLFDDLRAMFDALRTRWNEDVVGYDLRQQVSALRGVFDWFRSFRSQSSRELDADPSPEASLPTVGEQVWVWLGGALLIGLLVFGVRRWRRRGGPAESEIVAVYRQLERALARAGRPRPPGRTPREHAQQLVDEEFEHAQAVSDVTEAYLAARWGGAPADLAVLRARVRSVRG